MSCSETESELEADLTAENTTSLEAFAQLAARESRDNVTQRSVSWAVDTLAMLDFRLVRKDPTLYRLIQSCATTILGFFDMVLLQEPTSATLPTLIPDIANIFKPSFLHLLFQYRRLFYVIAARDVTLGSSPAAVICWVDIVLAKLSDIAAFVAAGLRDDHSDEEFPSVLKTQRQEDNLRAATQLPDKWDMVPPLLLSERVSPATKRLSLRLMLGMYILYPMLSGKTLDNTIQNLLSTFSEFVRQTARRLEDPSSGSRSSVVYLVQQERFNCAIAISLLAAAEIVQNADLDAASHNDFRPRTMAAAMQLLRFVIQGDSLARTESLIPSDYLDSATNIVIWWGVIPQWSWSVWSEYRGLHTDVIFSLTTTYIQHRRLGSGASLTVSDLVTRSDSSKSQEAVIGFMIELVFRYNLLLSTGIHPSSSYLPTSVMDMLYEICGFIAQWMKSNACGIQKSAECCRALMLLFCHLSQTEQYVSLKDKILECLAPMRAQCTRDAWEGSRIDAKFRTFGALNQAFIQTKQSLLQKDPKCEGICAAQLMQFCIILIFKGVKAPSLEGVITFIEVVWERILGTEPDNSALLRETLLTCLATSNLCATGLEFHGFLDEEAIWQVGMLGSSESLTLTCAFSLYITSIPPRVEPLTYLEGVDHLLDTTLLICSRHYVCEYEPLGLITLPTICDALLRLLEHKDDITGVHIETNPRLIALRNFLRSLEAKGGSMSEKYRAILLERLSSRTTRLLSEIAVHNDEVVTRCSTKLEKRGYELLFCRFKSDGLSHLMLVPD